MSLYSYKVDYLSTNAVRQIVLSPRQTHIYHGIWPFTISVNIKRNQYLGGVNNGHLKTQSLISIDFIIEVLIVNTPFVCRCIINCQYHQIRNISVLFVSREMDYLNTDVYIYY